MSENIDKVDDNTLLITAEKYETEQLRLALSDFQDNTKFHSVYFNEEKNSLTNINIETIDQLALGAQNDLKKIQQINSIVKFYVNKNDILGKVYEAIETNVNADYTLKYPEYTEEERETFKKVEELIKDFNESIGLEQLIIDAIPMTYLEGNYPLYLRKKDDKYQVDYYPLGIVEVSDYTVNGEPYLLLNIKELKSRLQKIYRKDKKKKPLFYANMDQEVKSAYPKEVFEAYKNNEEYAKLDLKNTGIMRINNFKRKYGLTPIFKSLKPVIRLENIELSDDKNTLVRGKKIIFQKLAKELVFDEKNQTPQNLTWSTAQAKAHMDLMKSLQMKNVSVYTGLPWTESIEYIEPKIEQTNVNIKNQYRENIMTSVGISYLLNNKGGYGSAQISIQELMKTINKIGKQLEQILVKWYRNLLADNGIDQKYCPKIKIIDSEKLSTELSMSLARMLHNELNAPLDTVYSVLGLDIKTEARKRIEEKEKGYNEIFVPRLTAFTNTNNNNSDNQGGRPSDGKDPDKTLYDQEEYLENGE